MTAAVSAQHGIPAIGRAMSASAQLARHARAMPDEVALRLGTTDRRYGELDARVSRLARALARRGITAGERVVVLGRNLLETAEAILACSRLGAVCVPLNLRLAAAEVSWMLEHSGALGVVVDSAFAPLLAEARRSAPTPRFCLVIGGGDAGPASEEYERALGAESAEHPGTEPDDQSAALLMYTSGTTGLPKGAVITHHNLLMHNVSLAAHLGVATDDRVSLLSTPLFHIAGLASFAFYLMLGGRTVLTTPGRFDPAEAVSLLESERVSACLFVPTQWQQICALPDIAKRDLSSLRRITWGGAPASPDLLRALLETFPQAQLTAGLGMTECSSTTCVLRGADALRKFGSVGTPMLNVEARVVDESMRDVPAGEVGELVYRGPSVMSGYWRSPEATAEAFHGGWFHSGDMARRDEDGYLFLVDRKKDIIISGGENISSIEVEGVLSSHPLVAEAAVIGVPHPRWGETPLAVVVAKDPAEPPTLNDLTAWCQNRLARYKHPTALRLVSELPRNAGGKVLKHQLRRQEA